METRIVRIIPYSGLSIYSVNLHFSAFFGLKSWNSQRKVVYLLR